MCEAATDEEAEEGLSCDRLTFFPALTEAPAVTEDPDGPEPCSSLQDCQDIRSILQEMDPGEEVLLHGVMCLVICLAKNVFLIQAEIPPTLLIFKFRII